MHILLPIFQDDMAVVKKARGGAGRSTTAWRRRLGPAGHLAAVWDDSD